MCEQKFFRCQQCGNMVGAIRDAGTPMVCCGQPMQKLEANTTDGAVEKHLPVVEVRERLVYAKVGGVEHPMTKEHHIEFIYLQTQAGGQLKRLYIDKKADAMFAVLHDAPICVYAYCNLHGLWKASVPLDGHCGKNDEENTESCSAEFAEGCK